MKLLKKDSGDDLEEEITRKPTNRQKSANIPLTIVYVGRRDETESLAEYLTASGSDNNIILIFVMFILF